ncbi:MAG: hypothetical protein HYR67_03935 [Bacteroidetes bacterium]|nr:hypothetical protein [Bacteroidota bacterium]
MKKLRESFFYMVALLFGANVISDLQAQTCYLTRVIEADGDTISLSYDGNNHISSLGKNTTVKTNSGGHIVEIIHDEAATNSLARATFSYDNNNNLIKYEQFMGAATTPAFITRFTYNSFNQLIETQSAVAVGPNYFYGYRVFSYPNTTIKNPSTIKAYSGNAQGKTGNPDETITLVYDDKKTTGYVNPLDDFNPFTTHNVVSATVVEVGGKPKTETFIYQYNVEGYPISKIEKEGGRTFNTTFSYNCK